MSAGHFGQAGPVMSAGHFTSSWTTFWTGWTRYECWTLYQQLDYILEGLDPVECWTLFFVCLMANTWPKPFIGLRGFQTGVLSP